MILDVFPHTVARMKIGQRIRRRRQELDLSLEKLGEIIGVSRSAVHQWETKDDAGITTENLIKLSEAIELPIADLLPQTTIRDMTIKDPNEILLIQRFRVLPPPQKEVCVRLIVVMSDDQPQGNPPPR